MGTVGERALRLAADLVSKQEVPIAILNGGKGALPIAEFLPLAGGTSNNYQHLKGRLDAFGLAASVRAVFFYQGEADIHDDDPLKGRGYFDSLVGAWQLSFPKLVHVYVTQVRGCNDVYGTRMVREAQRQLAAPLRSPDVQVMSTTAMMGFDGGCHFYYAGYQQLGHWYASLLARDVYAGATANISAPAATQVQRGAGGVRLLIRLANQSDPITVDAGSKQDFVVTTATGRTCLPTSVSASPGLITLTIPAGAASAQRQLPRAERRSRVPVDHERQRDRAACVRRHPGRTRSLWPGALADQSSVSAARWVVPKVVPCRKQSGWSQWLNRQGRRADHRAERGGTAENSQGHMNKSLAWLRPETLLAVLVTAFCLAACGGSDEATGPSSADAQSMSMAEAEGDAEVTGEAEVASAPRMAAEAVRRQAETLVSTTTDVVALNFPVDHQLYPRARIGDTSVSINVNATRTAASIVSVTLTTQTGSEAAIVSTAAFGDGNTVALTASVPVKLAATSFTLMATTSSGNSVLVVKAIDVVAGDVFVVEGQSNALATKHPEQDKIVALDAASPWIRTVGGTWEFTAQSDADHAWYVAKGGGVLDGSGTIGKWPLRMARDFVDELQVPIAVINGARGSEAIAYFLPDYVQAGDTGNNYQRLLSRLRAYDLTSSVRAVFFYQGENDAARGSPTATAWSSTFSQQLLPHWNSVFENLSNVYVTQIRGCNAFAETNDVREQQRKLATTAKIQVMSTTAMPGFDGCHFFYTGYQKLGHWYARLVLKDLYGSTITDNVTAPAPRSARISGKTLTIQLENTSDAIQADAASKADFFVATATGLIHPNAITGSAAGGTITLTLPASASGVTSVSYRSHRSKDGPYVMNKRSVGLLAFEGFPVGR